MPIERRAPDYSLEQALIDDANKSRKDLHSTNLSNSDIFKLFEQAATDSLTRARDEKVEEELREEGDLVIPDRPHIQIEINAQVVHPVEFITFDYSSAPFDDSTEHTYRSWNDPEGKLATRLKVLKELRKKQDDVREETIQIKHAEAGLHARLGSAEEKARRVKDINKLADKTAKAYYNTMLETSPEIVLKSCHKCEHSGFRPNWNTWQPMRKKPKVIPCSCHLGLHYQRLLKQWPKSDKNGILRTVNPAERDAWIHRIVSVTPAL